MHLTAYLGQTIPSNFSRYLYLDDLRYFFFPSLFRFLLIFFASFLHRPNQITLQRVRILHSRSAPHSTRAPPEATLVTAASVFRSSLPPSSILSPSRARAPSLPPSSILSPSRARAPSLPRPNEEGKEKKPVGTKSGKRRRRRKPHGGECEREDGRGRPARDGHGGGDGREGEFVKRHRRRTRRRR